MLIVYASRTGMVRNFVNKTEFDKVFIDSPAQVVDKPFILVTYTDKFGEVPDVVSEFLEHNKHNLLGVASSGRKIWGKDLFARSGDKISEKYNVPLILKFEMSGTKNDVQNFSEGVLKIYDKLDYSQQ